MASGQGAVSCAQWSLDAGRRMAGLDRRSGCAAGVQAGRAASKQRIPAAASFPDAPSSGPSGPGGGGFFRGIAPS